MIYLTLKLRGYDLRTSFLTAVNLSQFSEFGLIIISSSVLTGWISSGINAIAIILLIATFVSSSYMIKYDRILLRRCEKLLARADSYFPARKNAGGEMDAMGYQIMFFGYYDLGKEFFSKMETLGKRPIVVENDPANIHLLKQEGIPYLYGSVSNPYFLEHLNFNNAEIVVSSIVNVDESKNIIKTIKQKKPNSVIIVTAKSIKNSLELYDAGADYVIYPSYLNEQNVSVLLEDYTSDINKIITKKINDLTRLKIRQEKLKGSETIFNINDFMKQLSKIENKLKKNR